MRPFVFYLPFLLLATACSKNKQDIIVDALPANQTEINIAYLQDMAKEYPEDGSIQYRLAKEYLSINDIENAYISIKKALEQSKGNSGYYFVFTTCLLKKGLYADAYDYIQKVDPAVVPEDDYNPLATDVYLKNNRFREALSLMEKQIKNHPPDARFISQQALIYAHIGDTAKALEKCNEALKKDSALTAPLLFIAKYDIGHGQFENAVIGLKKAARKDTMNIEIYFNLALAYKNLGYKDFALANYEKCLAIDSNYYSAVYNSTILYLQENNFHKAEKHLRKLKQMKPGDSNLGFPSL